LTLDEGLLRRSAQGLLRDWMPPTTSRWWEQSLSQNS